MEITGGLSELQLNDAYVLPNEKLTPVEDLWNHIHTLKEELNAMAVFNVRVNTELARYQELVTQYSIEHKTLPQATPPPWSTKPHLLAPLINAYDNRIQEFDAIVESRDQQVKQLVDEIKTLTIETTSQKQELKQRAFKIRQLLQDKQDGHTNGTSGGSMNNLAKILEERATLLANQNAILIEERNTALQAHVTIKRRLDRILEDREVENTPSAQMVENLNRLRSENGSLSNQLTKLMSDAADHLASEEKLSVELMKSQSHEIEMQQKVSELENALQLAATELEQHQQINLELVKNSPHLDINLSTIGTQKRNVPNTKLELALVKDSLNETTERNTELMELLERSDKNKREFEIRNEELTRFCKSLESQLTQARARAERAVEESLGAARITEDLRTEKEKLRRQIEDAETRHAASSERLHASLAQERRDMELRQLSLEEEHKRSTQTLRERLQILEESLSKVTASNSELERDLKRVSSDRDSMNSRLEMYRQEAERARQQIIAASKGGALSGLNGGGSTVGVGQMGERSPTMASLR